MFLCSLIEELCKKEENDKAGCNFNFGHQCISGLRYIRLRSFHDTPVEKSPLNKNETVDKNFLKPINLIKSSIASFDSLHRMKVSIKKGVPLCLSIIKLSYVLALNIQQSADYPDNSGPRLIRITENPDNWTTLKNGYCNVSLGNFPSHFIQAQDWQL